MSYQCLTEEEKIERMKKLHEKLQKERDRLKAKLAKVVECEGVNVDSTTNADLHTIAQSEAFRVVGEFSPGSFQHLLGATGRGCLSQGCSWYEVASPDDTLVLISAPSIIRCVRNTSYFWLRGATLPAHTQGLHPLREGSTWVLIGGRSTADDSSENRHTGGVAEVRTLAT